MAKRSFQVPSFTPTATADTINLANASYMAIQAGASTTALNIIEIYQGGMNTSSAVNLNMWARDSTVGGTPTALAAPNSDGPLNTVTTATTSPPVSFVGAPTIPQRSAVTTAARLALSFNSFGGIVRWVAAPGEEWSIYGTTASVSESSLSGFTGSGAGLQGAHIIYEPL